MAVRVKLGELPNMVQGLNALVGKELPYKTAYWVSRVALKVDKESRLFEEARIKMLMRFTKYETAEEAIANGRPTNPLPLMNGNSFDLADPQGFAKAFNDLAQEEIEINVNPFTHEQLEKLEVSGATLLMLGPLVPGEEDDGADKVE
jgi:hypothetical protein